MTLSKVWFHRSLPALSALMAGLAFSPTAQASVTMYVYQAGPNVIATASGSYNIAALSTASTGAFSGIIAPTSGQVVSGVGAVTLLQSISGPTNVGSSGVPTFSSSSSGSPVGVAASLAQLYVPSGYSSGDAITSSSTWNNKTISGLGMTPGIYTWTWGSGANADSFVLNIGTAPPATPVPSSLYLVIAGMLCLGAFHLYRVRKGPQAEA